MIRVYFILTKPGIILGNIITTTAGFLLASKGHFDPYLFLATVVGLALIIASACVFNNAIDRDADKKMDRTKDRALVKGLVSVKSALFFALAIGFAGGYVLAAYTNVLTALVALSGFLLYVVVYSFWKYRSTNATFLGSIAGAVPPVVGYLAVKGQFDAAAWILFAIVLLWQMPHFYAIAVYRMEEYVAASIPVLPTTRGMFLTKVVMALYIVAFMVATFLMLTYGYTGTTYLISALILGFSWLTLSLFGFQAKDDTRWAKQMFKLSLFVITALCILIGADGYGML